MAPPPDPTVFLLGFGGLLLLGVLITVLLRWQRWWSALPKSRVEATKPATPEERHRREEEARIREEVKAGHRLVSGHVRCTVGTNGSRCPLPASHPRLVFERAHGPFAWLKERVGAPTRWSIGITNHEDLLYCASHVHLAEQEMLVHLSDVERERVRLVRDAELELGDFERRGLAIRLSELHEGQEKSASKRKKPETQVQSGRVVPIRAAGGS